MIYRAASGVWRIGQPGLATSRLDWWLAGGTISEANTREHVELPGFHQQYLGGDVTGGNPWTMAVRTDGIVSSTNSGTKYIFSGDSNIPTFGMNDTNAPVYTGSSWQNRPLFVDTANHVFFLVCNGTSIQCYSDNVAVGTVITSGVFHIDATPAARWRGAYGGSGGTWPNGVQYAAVYDIALNATQRAALYTEMAA